ncbi:MAG: septum formation initiator family protein [Clostridia bacterium]|nr:septum formation initiator family protein [Clostridia bacterium]
MTPQKIKRIVRLSTVLVTVFIVVAAIILTYQLVKIGTLNKKLADLDRQSASLTIQQQQLEQGIEIRNTGTYVEQTAREQYGLSTDGEKIFVQQP